MRSNLSTPTGRDRGAPLRSAGHGLPLALLSTRLLGLAPAPSPSLRARRGNKSSLCPEVKTLDLRQNCHSRDKFPAAAADSCSERDPGARR